MAEYGEKPKFLVGNVSGLILLILGFLILAAGYRDASTGLMTTGIEEQSVETVEIDRRNFLERDRTDVGDHVQPQVPVVRMPCALLEDRRQARRQPLVDEELGQ